VGASFFDTLKLNGSINQYGYLRLCRSAMCIIQQVTIVFVFLFVWFRVQEGSWSGEFLLSVDAFALLAGCCGSLIRRSCSDTSHIGHTKDSGCSPVSAKTPVIVLLLHQIACSWSNNTVGILSFTLLTVHVFSSDYTSTGSSDTGCAYDTSAFRAAILAATILASRLRDPLRAIAFFVFAVEAFAFYPILSKRLFCYSPLLHTFTLTPLLTSTATSLCRDRRDCIALCVIWIGIGFVGPAAFILAQRHKMQIEGPWDVPVLTQD